MLFCGSENHHDLLYAVPNSLEFSPVLSKQCACGQMVARCKTCDGLASAAQQRTWIFFHCAQIFVKNLGAATHVILDPRVHRKSKYT